MNLSKFLEFMLLKTLKEHLKELLLVEESLKTKKINELWSLLKDLKEDTHKNKLIKLLDKSVIGHLKNLFKQGAPILGSYETKLIQESPTLKLLRSKWARKRGASFERVVLNFFKKHLEVHNLKAFVLINRVSKFEYQPFDLVIYRKNPILLECKASGVSKKKEFYRIDPCSRRYQCYKKNLEKIQKTIHQSEIPFCFVFGNLADRELIIVPHREITNNLETLNTKYHSLNSYLKVSLDEPSPENLLELIEKL